MPIDDDADHGKHDDDTDKGEHVLFASHHLRNVKLSFSVDISARISALVNPGYMDMDMDIDISARISVLVNPGEQSLTVQQLRSVVCQLLDINCCF